MRPLSTRSVLLSVLLGSVPPELPVRSLIRTGALFGIAEGTVRTALSRMAAAGEVEAVDGRYRLAPRLVERQHRQERARRPELRSWSGEWRAAVVRAERRPATDRAELRTAMATLRFAELREGVWVRPDNLGAEPASVLAVARDQCDWFQLRPDGSPVELAHQLWDLEGWAAEAGRLRGEITGWAKRLDAGEPDVLAGAFVASAEVLRHFLTDPMLPSELVPTDWPGSALRAAYDAFDLQYRAALRAWIRAD